MATKLAHEIAELASEARRRHMNQNMVRELTIIMGYAHMAEVHPLETFYSAALRKHLRALTDLACVHGHEDLCEHAQRIVHIVTGNGDLR